MVVCQWTYPDCGTLQDRDVNADKNPLAYGLAVQGRSTASSDGSEAYRGEGSSRRRKTAVKLASMRQEVIFVSADELK
ncbi:hypothetical protein A7K73_00195 [Candidatus Methylacidiphilum fumarolicum]|nr:hypothetical protein A7K73_00195 [Candidatus Methylacidiphilum fumarolicum]TFE78004.1 hypothetical protein A7D33_00355 [Candidatus Methylacidiphilum fumarolicum]